MSHLAEMHMINTALYVEFCCHEHGDEIRKTLRAEGEVHLQSPGHYLCGVQILRARHSNINLLQDDDVGLTQSLTLT